MQEGVHAGLADVGVRQVVLAVEMPAGIAALGPANRHEVAQGFELLHARRPGIQPGSIDRTEDAAGPSNAPHNT